MTTDNSSQEANATTPEVTAPSQPGLLFEIAWEVCTQVGGIYTVLRSKAPATVRRWGNNYCLIGPYREHSARVELEPQPPWGPIAEAMKELKVVGVNAHFGRWLITGRPQALLLETGAAFPRVNEQKFYLWKDHGVDCSPPDGEFDEVVAFGLLVQDFLRSLAGHAPAQPVLAHFHEWQGAAALPALARSDARIATVFTTHATLVGRSLSSANVNLYDNLKGIDADIVARVHGFQHRHGLERAAAQNCDVFTTVSGITAMEAEQFLGRRPEVVLPNGLNVERFAAPHEFQVLHQQAKQLINEFVMGHFFPSYTFDLDRTLYVFTAGRYEYRNKGLDVFIESLGELNRRMKADAATSTVVAFIVTRANTRAPNVETLGRHAMFHELRDICESIKHDMGRRLFYTVARGKMPTTDDLLGEYDAVRLKRMMYAWRQGMPPTIVTHDMVDDGNDPVLKHLRHRGLFNHADDRVKIVFHPEFMSVTSPILALEYDQFVRGCHLGVFPSYYEPWGYTPLECIVRGVPAVTSDLAGFGNYVMENHADHNDNGMFVARRRGVGFDATVNQVVEWLYGLTRMSRRERIALRNRVEAHAEDFDWTALIEHYVEAHELALKRRYAQPIPVPPDPEAAVFRQSRAEDASTRPAQRRPRAGSRTTPGASAE